VIRAATRRALRFGARVAVMLLPGIVLLVLTPGTGWAADRLTSAAPADGSALSTGPEAVVLRFSAPVDLGLSHVSVRDAAGDEVGAGEPISIDGTGLRLPVVVRSTGDHTVAFHIVFDGGADLIGVLRFSVGTGVPPSPLSRAEVQQAQQAVVTDHDHSVDPLSAVLLLLDLAVLVAVSLLLARRPSRTIRD
jgi:copper resistance protein C